MLRRLTLHAAFPRAVPALVAPFLARASSGTGRATPAGAAEARAQEAALQQGSAAEQEVAGLIVRRARAEAAKAESDAATKELDAARSKLAAAMDAAKAELDAAALALRVVAQQAEASAEARALAVAARSKMELDRAFEALEAKKASAAAQQAGAKALANTAAVTRLLLPFLPWIICIAAAAALAVDYYTHESMDYIGRSMLATLRKCAPPPSLPSPPPTLLPAAQTPLELGFLPTLLMGPFGCGKSTLLASIAASLPTPAPVVLVRLRMPAAQPADDPYREGQVLMDAAARQIFPQIGFPLRRSILAEALDAGLSLLGKRAKAELSTSTRDRLLAALRLLFEVCEELKLERQKTMDPLSAAPVLLFDEVQDLVQDTRLRRAGGKLVLDMLGALIVGYCVDRRAVRAVVAGSSAELYFELAKSTPLHGARWEYYDLQGPDKTAVVSALIARGYSAEEALSMVDLCGTRLRLLEEPLTRGQGKCSAAGFLSGALFTGCTAFSGIFSKLSRADAAQLSKLLDSIEACEAAQDATAQSEVQKGAEQWPDKEMLPASLKSMDLSPILFFDRQRRLLFQSQLHRRAWKQLRRKYA